MLNLVQNAINYTKETDAEITVHLSRQDDAIRIRVKDNGVGIPKEDVNRIFERFYRVDKSRAKDRGGIGLGLAIVKHILEAHQQKVSVESEVGVGSVFSFNLRQGTKEKALVEDFHDQ